MERSPHPIPLIVGGMLRWADQRLIATMFRFSTLKAIHDLHHKRASFSNCILEEVRNDLETCIGGAGDVSGDDNRYCKLSQSIFVDASVV